MLPQDIKAESEILSTILVNNDALLDVIEALSPEDFYRTSNQEIYRIMIEMFKEDIPIDYVTIANKMGDEKVKAIGGVSYLIDLGDGGLKSTNIKQYAKIVKDKSNRRKLIEMANSILKNIDGSINELKATAEDCLTEISLDRKNKILTDAELMEKTITYIEANYKNGGKIVGMKTYYPSIDDAINGIVKKDLIVIAGRPSMGKTCLALNIASNLANDNKVAMFELEMSAEKLGARRLAARAMINASKLPRGLLDDKDWRSIAFHSDCITRRNNMFTDCTSDITITEIKAKCKKLKLKYGLDVVVIDHIGLLTPTNPSASRTEQIGEITRQAKILAKELDVAVILISQLNRGVESRNNKRPMMSDLRESGNIEQDADLIMAVYRDEYYNKETVDKGVMEILVLKQRDGETGTIRMAYKSEYQLIGELSEG